jgi:hypothetical protein
MTTLLELMKQQWRPGSGSKTRRRRDHVTTVCEMRAEGEK